MDGYIKIEDAAKAFSFHSPYRYEDCLNALTSSILDGTIEAADVAPVGHCKDCIHYFQSECLKIYDDGACSEYARQTRKPYDFCSYFKPIPAPEH